MLKLRFLRYGLIVTVETISWLLFLLPRFRILNGLKSAYLRTFFGAKIGRRVVFYSGVWIFTGRNLQVGDDVDFAKGVLITTDGGVNVGDRTLVGYGTKILSSNHRVPANRAQIFGAGHEKSPVTIERDCWIGANCVILPGVTVGQGSIVCAGSVVTKSVEPFVYAAGVPARIIRRRQ